MISETPTPLGPRAQQKQETRTRLLAVAREVLEARGYDETNIRDLAKRAGVSPGTVLLHFRDKQDLLHAALFDELERTWLAVRDKARHRSLASDLMQIAEAFFDHYLSRPRLSRALLKESLFALPPWQQRFVGQAAAVGGHIQAVVQRAVREGRIAASADPALVTASFFSFYYFALIAWVQGGIADPKPFFQHLLDGYLGSLSSDAPKAPKRRRK